MKYIVTVRDILSKNLALNGEQLILSILKEKAAPINGVFYLEADFKNYFWSCEVNNLTGDIVYETNKKYYRG